jgi:hypothetical protein
VLCWGKASFISQQSFPSHACGWDNSGVGHRHTTYGPAARLGTDYQKMSAGHCVGLSDEMGLATSRKEFGWCENLRIMTRQR